MNRRKHKMKGQEITVRAEMTPVGKNNLMAVGSVYLDEMIVIHQVKLINKVEEDGQSHPVLGFPSRKRGEDWEKIVKIKDTGLYERIRDEVVAATGRAIAKKRTGIDLKVEIRPFNKGETRAYATLIFDDAVQIENVRICEKEGKLAVYYPYEKNGEYYQNLAGPASHQVRQVVEEQILEAYQMKTRTMETEIRKDADDLSEDIPSWEERGPVR